MDLALPQVIVIDTTEGGWFSSGIDCKCYQRFMSEYEKLDDSLPLTIKITSTGGNVFYTLLIANAVAKYPHHTTAEISRYAMSGATVIALMCDTIKMTSTACLGPIDLQMTLPVKAVLPTVAKWKESSFICGIVHDVFNGFQTDYLQNLRATLKLKWDDAVIEKIISYFYDRFQHDTPIFAHNILDTECGLDVVVDEGLGHDTKPEDGSGNFLSRIMGG